MNTYARHLSEHPDRAVRGGMQLVQALLAHHQGKPELAKYVCQGIKEGSELARDRGGQAKKFKEGRLFFFCAGKTNRITLKTEDQRSDGHRQRIPLPQPTHGHLPQRPRGYPPSTGSFGRRGCPHDYFVEVFHGLVLQKRRFFFEIWGREFALGSVIPRSLLPPPPLYFLSSLPPPLSYFPSPSLTTL